MKKVRASSGLLNLDVLALSLLCCLLASVVGVLVLSGEASPSTPAEPSQDTVVVWTKLHEQTAKLYTRVQQEEHSREALINKINYSLLDRANRDQEARISEIQQKLDIVDKIKSATLEIASIRKQLENLESQTNPPPSSEVGQIVGKYKGPFILIECVEDEAVIYPGGRRVEMEPSADQADELINQITNAGFVALVVRPSGWYENSFDKLRKLIYDRLDQIENDGGKRVGRSTFPLTDEDSITNYLPPQSKP